MGSMLKSQEQAKVAIDEHTNKLKEEIRALKAERAQLEQKLLEMESVGISNE